MCIRVKNYCYYQIQDEQAVQIRREGLRRKRPRPLRVLGRRRENASVQLQFASGTRVPSAKNRNPGRVNIDDSPDIDLIMLLRLYIFMYKKKKNN